VFATNLGVPANPATPVAALLVAAVIALILANVTAAAPAVLAARLDPAPALRSD
jgi:ABC-type lipoprotein release transport system permease subunit